MPLGFNGKILHVDLIRSTFTTEQPPEIFYRRYFGGRAFVAYYLLNQMKGGEDALGPDNVLVFASSVIGGAPSHGLCRFSVGAKSPLTGGFGESEAGGFWGPELKFAGFDAVVIKGKAQKPVYLWIHDGQAELRDATALWGKVTGEAQDALKEELSDPRLRALLIGPAGENQVPYANIANDLSHMSGRTGMGAVMGSKMLKAVVCRGTRRGLTVKDMKQVGQIAKRVARDRDTYPLSSGLHRLGTPAAIQHFNHLGTLPTRNFRKGHFEGAENISGERMMETRLERREGCFSCAIQCRARVTGADDRFTIEPRYGRPEYETLAALGCNLEIDDLDAVIKGNEMCNKLGLDSISMGVSIAFVMDCNEQGLLPEDWKEGLDPRFGDADLMLRLIEDTAYRRGLGVHLAKGVRAMAEALGPEALRLAVQTKGQEVPLHDGRGKAAVAFGYAVVEKGADHLVSGFDLLYETAEHPGFLSVAPLGILEPMDVLDMGPKKIRLFTYMSFLWSFYNCASICNFAFVPRSITTMDETVQLVRAITGWDTSLWELMKVGERAINLARVYNVREGFTRKDDSLPERFFQPLEGKGPLKGYHLDRDEFEKALDLYYAMMGWDGRKGAPTFAKLLELDIDWVWDLIS
ncbi:MAG: aldehyde ferredoxin oxidoreductase family protein [Deltaproteobacteria bacterium]|nr:aldehyde ferredoxin oxidoreductase family protein [Deltaproteobacteria bacterium]